MCKLACMLAALAMTLAACSDSSKGCSSSQVQVEYLGGGSDGKMTCAAIPSACGGTASCAAQPCIAAMYGLCASPYIGVGCSDTAPPTIISCNP
jgi:hypothetical protein